MRKTWFHGLALTLGVTTLPSVASAQYTIGNNAGGLAASSFSATQNQLGVRNLPPNAPTALAAYAQNGVVGSGIQNGHVHVPGSAIDNSVLNSQYQSIPQYAAPAVQPYEQLHSPQMQSVPASPSQNGLQYGAPQQSQPMFSSPMASPSTAVGSSCPACNTGNCATHGVGIAGAPLIQSAPDYGMVQNYAESCGAPAVSYAPSVVSPSPWIFGASGLIFNRLNDDHVRLTTNTENGLIPSPTPNPYVQSFLSTSDAAMQPTGGVQFNVGRYFGSGRYAIMGTYWGIFSNPQTATILASDQINGNLRSNLPITLRGPGGTWQYGMTMPGQTAYDWYDGSFAHRIVRDQEFHSAELNFFSFALGGGARQAYAAEGCGGGGRVGFGSGAVRSLGRGGHGGGHGGRFGGGHGGGHGAGDNCGPDACGSGECGDACQSSCAPVACSGPTGPCAPWFGAQCSKLRLNMYGGVRWFRFRDSLEYASSENDAIFNGGADDFYYRNGVTNDLVGFQLGGLGTWCTGTRFNLFGGTNFGVYGNHINATTFAGTTTQTAYLLSPNTAFDGRPYDYASETTGVSLLGEGTLGTGVRISRGWTANVAYRLVGVSGVATAVGQIPRDFSRGDEITRINNNHSLLLHGVSLGAFYNF